MRELLIAPMPNDPEPMETGRLGADPMLRGLGFTGRAA